jgi:hypothetical protein
MRFRFAIVYGEACGERPEKRSKGRSQASERAHLLLMDATASA